MSSEIKTEIQLEIGHVLFMDIVDYSTRLINEQCALRDTLNEIVRSTEAFRDADAAALRLRVRRATAWRSSFTGAQKNRSIARWKSAEH
jgi:hypothetical protein